MAETAGNRRAMARARWTPARRESLLDLYAATGDLAAAAAAQKVTAADVYALARADGEFAARWREAREICYDRLEGELLLRALRPECASELAAIDIDLAFRLLGRVKPGEPRRGKGTAGTPSPRPSAEETDAAILKKLAAMEKRRRAGA